MIKRLFTAGLLCAGAAVFAQGPEVLGKVTEVQGVVTISDGVTISTAVLGTVITEGNQFVTASSGAARLTMDNGCVIRLKPNESLIINGMKSCRALIASIQSVGSNLAAATVGEGAASGGGVGLGAGFAAGAGAILSAGLAGGGSGLCRPASRSAITLSVMWNFRRMNLRLHDSRATTTLV